MFFKVFHTHFRILCYNKIIHIYIQHPFSYSLTGNQLHNIYSPCYIIQLISDEKEWYNIWYTYSMLIGCVLFSNWPLIQVIPDDSIIYSLTYKARCWSSASYSTYFFHLLQRFVLSLKTRPNAIPMLGGICRDVRLLVSRWCWLYTQYLCTATDWSHFC